MNNAASKKNVKTTYSYIFCVDGVLLRKISITFLEHRKNNGNLSRRIHSQIKSLFYRRSRITFAFSAEIRKQNTFSDVAHTKIKSVSCFRPKPWTTPGLSLAIKALRNFVYKQMDVDVKLAPTGDLNLLVKLQGHSPDVEKGRPINFNLNVSENLPALMESLKASDNFSKRVQQRLSKQPVN